jgi:hypothetical protein
VIGVTPEQERELGGLLLTGAATGNSMQLVRAAQWRNTLSRVGLAIPLWVVHDLGSLLVGMPDSFGTRAPLTRAFGNNAGLAAAHRTWVETLKEISATEMTERSRSWRLSDDLVSVVLLRVLSPLWERFLGPGRRPIGVPLPLDAELYATLEARLPPLFSASDRTTDGNLLLYLAKENLRLITAIEQIDLDTLKLLGMYGAEASAASAFGMIDLLNVLESPDANDVVNFSLDLLPSVLETKRASGAQTFSVDGYAGLARRGTLDSLMLSELAFDEDLFDQRYSESEVFYYAREKTREEDSRLHYVVCDATASMRGQRSVFARGLALTLAKKLQLRGEDVFFRFFDSRLYDVQQSRAKRRRAESGIDVPYVLAFKGEHGRNYAKVFGLLASEVARTAKREKKSVIFYVITHAECHVPMEVIERLRSVATLYGIFMLPSEGKLDLEWTSRLSTIQIVDEASLNKKDERSKRAIDILDDAAGERASLTPKAPTKVEGEKQRAEDLSTAEAELDAYLRGGG